MEVIKALWNGYGRAMAEAGGKGELAKVGRLITPLRAGVTTKELRTAGSDVAETVLSNMGLDGNAIGFQVELQEFLPLRSGEKVRFDEGANSEKHFATVMIFEGHVVLELQHDGERNNFELSSGCRWSCYAVFFKDCEHDVLPMEPGYCGVFRLSVGFHVPRGPSPWGFIKTLVKVKETMASWLEDDDCRSPKRFVIPLDHEYTNLRFSDLQGQDRLVVDLLANIPSLDIHLCNMKVTEKILPSNKKLRKYKLGDWVAGDDKPVEVCVSNNCFNEEVMYMGNHRVQDFLDEREPTWNVAQNCLWNYYQRRDIIANAIVIWPRKRRIENVGIYNFVESINAQTCVSDVVRDAVTFWAKHGAENIFGQLAGGPVEARTICKLMEVCLVVGTRNDCNEMIRILGRSEALLDKDILAKLPYIVQKHGWQPCVDSIVEFVVVKSRVVNQAGNFVSLAFELSLLAIKEARRSLLAAATAKTAALAVAGKTFQLVKENGIFGMLEFKTKVDVAKMVQEFLDADSYSEVLELIEENTTVDELSLIAKDERLFNLEWFCRNIKKKMMCEDVLLNDRLVLQLLSLEDKELCDMIVVRVKKWSRKEAESFNTETTLTELILPALLGYFAVFKSPLIAEAIKDIATDWIACVRETCIPEFSWRQPHAIVPNCPKLEGLLRGPKQSFYYRIGCENPVDQRFEQLIHKHFGIEPEGEDDEGGLDAEQHEDEVEVGLTQEERQEMWRLKLKRDETIQKHLKDLLEKRILYGLKLNGQCHNGASATAELFSNCTQKALGVVILVNKTSGAWDQFLHNAKRIQESRRWSALD